MSEIEVAPKHNVQKSGSRVLMAHEQIKNRDIANEMLRTAETNLEELAALREKPPRRNLFKRLRQRRQLQKWLEHQGYSHEELAHNRLNFLKKNSAKQSERSNKDLQEIWLPEMRKVYGNLDPKTKKDGDTLLRKYAPNEIIEACDTQSEQHGEPANIFEWMSQEPNEENPFGATNEQLETIALWNASHAETFASNPEAVRELVDSYLQKMQQKADAGELDPAWRHATPRIDRILIGDIMDARFLGHEGSNREGSYNDQTQTLTLWPYELGEQGLTETVDHEVTHSLGAFKAQWLNEGVTEMINMIVNDKSPTLQNDVYTSERRTIQTIIDNAPIPITFAEISKYYLGDDEEQNEQQLKAYLKNAYKGYDILGSLNNAYYDMLDNNQINELSPQKVDMAVICVEFTIKTIADCLKISQPNPNIAYGLRQLEQMNDNRILKAAYKNAAELFESHRDS